MGKLKDIVEKVGFFNFYYEQDKIIKRDEAGHLNEEELDDLGKELAIEIMQAFNNISDVIYDSNFDNDIVEVKIKTDFMIIKTERFKTLLNKLDDYEQLLKERKEGNKESAESEGKATL